MELGSHTGDSWVQAIGFKQRLSGRVGTCRIVISMGTGGNQLEAWLCSDSDGRPGQIMEHFTLSVPSECGNLLLRAYSILPPMLEAGKRYWLAVPPLDLKTKSCGWICSKSNP